LRLTEVRIKDAAMTRVGERAKRTEDPGVRRNQILDAARGCFRDNGFHPTTMAQIAGRAGISVGLIYQFFASKDALIEGIVHADFADRIAWMESLPVDAPFDLFEFCLNLNGDLFDLDRISLSLEISAELARNPPLSKMIEEKHREIIRFMVDRVRSRLPDGGGPDLEERIRLIVALGSGVAMQVALEGVQGKQRLFALFEQAGRTIAEHR
jgi:AcrR family transcriptional regulator